MAQLYTVGPAAIFVAIPNGGGAAGNTRFFLGHCEDSPNIQLRPGYEPVYNALTGTKVPFDLSQQGEEAFIGLALTRYNQNVIDLIRQRTVLSATFNGVPGTWGSQDDGTLMITENAAMEVWVTFPYSTTHPAMIAGLLPAGYHFSACAPIGPDDLGPLSTRARKEQVLFHAIRRYNASTGTKLLYDGSVAGLPAIN